MCSQGQFFLKHFNGKFYPLPFESEKTVSQYKSMIEEEFGINKSDQRLIFQSRQLQDNKTLADYQISRDHIIHLTLPLRGD